jgi:hypothetical protein
MEKVKSEIGEVSAAAVGDLLHDLERGHAIGSDATQFSVDISRFALELRKGGRNCRVFFRPIEAGPRQQIQLAALNPRRHAIAVKLDFVSPLWAGRRFGSQLGKLRFDPAGEKHPGFEAASASSHYLMSFRIPSGQKNNIRQIAAVHSNVILRRADHHIVYRHHCKTTNNRRLVTRSHSVRGRILGGNIHQLHSSLGSC